MAPSAQIKEHACRDKRAARDGQGTREHTATKAPTSSIYLYLVDSWTISRELLVGLQTLAHSGNDLRERSVFTNSFSNSVAGGSPRAARAYRLRELCKHS